MRCEYKCDQGWLPVDGIEDMCDGLSMLMPTEYTACFACNDAAWTNYDLDDEYEDTSDLTRSMLNGGQ